MEPAPAKPAAPAPAETAAAISAAEAAVAVIAAAVEAGILIVPPAARLALLIEIGGIRGGTRVMPSAAGILLPAAAVVAVDVPVRPGIDVVAVMSDAIGVG